jgi:hypothetical protein
MKVIIAGGRDVTNYAYVEAAAKESGFDITEVVSGCARGADTLGEMWAKANSLHIKKFPADWDNLGKKAGHVRNCQMGDYADALIALWDGESRGTKHMIDYATKKGLKVFVFKV